MSLLTMIPSYHRPFPQGNSNLSQYNLLKSQPSILYRDNFLSPDSMIALNNAEKTNGSKETKGFQIQ